MDLAFHHAVLHLVEGSVKAIDTLLVLALVLAAFGAGAQFDSHRIQATCEDDDGHTVINGTEYLCLSARHLDLIRRSRGRET